MKKRKVSKLITSLLVLVLLIGLFPVGKESNLGIVKAATTLNNPRIVADSSMQAGQKVTWDCIWFGAYPQSEVTSGEIYNTLKNATGWDEDNDIVINGNKYRRLKGEDATSYTTDDSEGYYNWNNDYSTYHYFKYEPIKWRVLEVSNGQALLLTDKVLDNQKYNKEFVNITWEISSIRSWLNGKEATSNQPKIDYTKKSFINTAFSENEQKSIFITHVTNNNNIEYGTSSGNNTFDKIFLLAESQVYTEKSKEYGFSVKYATPDEARSSQVSSYAFAMGCYKSTRNNYKDCTGWWLRSSGSGSLRAANVNYFGYVHGDGRDFINNGDGVRPALYLSLSASNLYSYAGTVCSGETNNIPSGNNSNNNNNTGNDKNNTTTSISSKPSNTTNATKKPTKQVLLPVEKMTGSLKTVKSPKKSTLAITWKKLSKITGYQVQFCAKKNFKKGTIERKFKKKVTKTQVGPLKSKKKYYVRMRPYTKSGSKMYYGKWSKVKSVKIR